MLKKINKQLIVSILLSMADEAIIAAVVIVVLSQLGIAIPFWVIVLLVLVFLAITLIIYRSLRKSPQLGFENMVGQSGLAVEPITRKGTVSIDGELWFARTQGEKIESGTEIIVMEQTGLKLTVAPKSVKKSKSNETTPV
jgi:membrane-bound ClpP family serine protease